MFKSVLISVANFEKSDSPYFVVMRECKTIVHSKLPLLSLQWNIQNNKKINYKKLEDDLTHDFSSLLQAFVYLDPS